MHPLVDKVSQEQCKNELPDFRVGDNIEVHYRITEGDKERIQVFKGTVIGHRGGSVNASFTVRRISYGIGVERVFPLHSPNIASIKVLTEGDVRRAKLYYLRDRVGKAMRVNTRVRARK